MDLFDEINVYKTIGNSKRKPKSKTIKTSNTGSINLRPGKDEHGYYLEVYTGQDSHGPCMTPHQVKGLISYLNKFVDWSES